ncbi:hypothetical protein PV433_18355 [Paenibacillus sp. GYB004]|uniref:hypothetical protein n=1 Tax=Paenibacillus sp. GYB004 TaxID=2994393 RepID=UPI002F96D312
MENKACTECGNKHYAKGLCVKCYHRNRKKSGTLSSVYINKKSSILANVETATPTTIKKCAAWKCNGEVYGMGVCMRHFKEWDMESRAITGTKR